MAEHLRDQLAVADLQGSFTWGALARRVDDAAQLLMSLGVKRGSIVTVQLPNWCETVVLSLAIWRLGAVLNPVTPIYRGSELRTIFGLAKPDLVLVPNHFGSTDYVTMNEDALAEAGIAASVVPIRPADGDGQSVPLGEAEASAAPKLTSLSVDEICLLMFTSGTTGRPKGVLHNQRSLMYEAWSIARQFDLSGPAVFMPSPLTHITGLLYGIVLPVLSRGSAVLQDRWNPNEAVDLIERFGCTFSVGATPFLVGLVKEYADRNQTSSIAAFVCGGADVPPSVIVDAHEIMGTIAVRAYGLTELPTLTCGSPKDSVDLRSGDDGVLTGTSEARLINIADGLGDLEARGPEMFVGYLDPIDNASAFSEDGWFRTGDIAAISGNRIRIAGRRKDIIIRGGENLSPVEVETLLRTMPGVLDCAVVGVPDVVFGERACAFIVSRDHPPTLADIREFLDHKQLARQKAPEHLIVVDELPYTPSGKVQKYLLRESAIRLLQAGEGESR